MYPKHFKIYVLIALGFWAACSHLVSAQETLPPREVLFAKQRVALTNAIQQQIDVLAPNTFSVAKQTFEDAQKDYDKARSLQKIRDKLTQSETTLTQASKIAESTRVTLATPLRARDDAVTAQAEKYAGEAWARAAGRFADAAIKVEKNDTLNAQKRGAEAEVLLREVELLAIKGSILGEARALLAKAEASKVMDVTPRTYTAAKTYLQQAESEITRSRYDTDVPRGLATQAAAEARHALYLAELIVTLQKKPKEEHALEEMLLGWEQPLKRMAAELGINSNFEEGYLKPTQEIMDRFQQLQRDVRNAKHDIDDRDSKLKMLELEMKRMEEKLGGVSEERIALQQRLDSQARQRADIAQVESGFTPQEARVFRQADDLVISLTAITFPIGKSTIEPGSFALMTKVQDAIKLFPNAAIIVEGHTDADGSDSANLILSQDRADAVTQFLISNAGLNAEKISSIGYGESRPVASNQNAEGKARNRRIDLIIQIGANQSP